MMAYTLLVWFIGALVIVNAQDELLAVNLVFRHGDRTPLKFYPNDPYKNPSFWPAPLGELTNMGKLQMYELGKWLRYHYYDFLSRSYNQNEVYVRSSDNDRCLMSAQCVLAGLYPPQGSEIWNIDLVWQPIPIHAPPPARDDFAEMWNSCPNYLRLFREASQLPYFKEINEKYKDLFELLTEKSGKHVKDLGTVYYLHDTLLVEQNFNFTLPNWAMNVFPQIEELSNNAQRLMTFTPELARLSLGRFFETLSSQFKYFQSDISNNSTNYKQKFRMLSSHDDQIFSILNVLKGPPKKNIPYAAMIVFELWKNRENGTYVNILYKTEDNTADILQLDICEENCELNKFLDIIEPYTLTMKEFTEKCNSKF